MSVTYTGTFWSAITRALLSLRRDKSLPTPDEASAINALGHIEICEYPVAKLNQHLLQLAGADVPERIGQSLLGYLDFNKMGSFHCYLSLAKDIRAALDAFSLYNTSLFEAGEQITIEPVNDTIRLSISSHVMPGMEPFIIAFYLALFRHLAGRDFDFTHIERVYAEPQWLLSAVTKANVSSGHTSLSVTFSTEWLDRPSFFYSPKLQTVLAKNLQHHSQPGFKQALLEAFKRFSAPARIRAEAVAESLGMTESKFRRTLKQEDLSFSSLLKTHIHELSINHLLGGDKVDELAEHLGFSDRRSFDRSFKEFTGVSPGQLRQVGSRLRFQRGNQALMEITENLPPLPETIGQIVNLPDDKLTVSKLVELISPDPVFLAHIIGKASRALYGTVPKSLEQAIGRNLGVNNVKNLAVIFAAQQYLTVQSVHPDIASLTDAMLLSNSLFERAFANDYASEEKALISQLLLFGPLALLLIFHSEHLEAESFYTHWQDSPDFAHFTNGLTNEYNLCLYGASSLLLIQWGFTSKVNQTLWRLCQDSEGQVNQRIKQCHALAFNHLCFNQPIPEQAQLSDTFTDHQALQIIKALEKC